MKGNDQSVKRLIITMKGGKTLEVKINGHPNESMEISSAFVQQPLMKHGFKGIEKLLR